MTLNAADHYFGGGYPAAADQWTCEYSVFANPAEATAYAICQ